jgi:predicted ATPase/class 3 adenylate cyclase/DNA-binding CsgD family transcriptional regulator
MGSRAGDVKNRVLAATKPRSSLPVGTLTFLMTDIEGSTRLWGAVPRAAKQVLRRHDRIVVAQVERNHGQIVESGREGDSVLAVFRHATNAVACAVDLQIALRREVWPAKVEVEVRGAIHTGEADLIAGHYVGAPLYRCARLMATGHGGQILVSRATEEIVADSLPDGVSLRDLGQHRLRDIARTEHVFQIMHPELRAEFPPLKSLEPERTNLAEQLTSFVGRQSELIELRKLLGTVRLVTLTGAGGSGKTRLAVQLASDLIADFPDGLWFVDLVPLSDSSLVPQKVMSAAGVREQADRSAQETLASFFATKRSLLILDNCEHLIDGVAAFVDALLRATVELTVLTTSREALRLAGEVVCPVLPLGLPNDDQMRNAVDLGRCDAVRLFTDRATLNLPGFELTDDNAGSVAAICRQLDGLPLAIELAAPRIASLSPTQFLARLGDRLSLVSMSSRTSSPKQRTLEATFDWSYQLLNDRERTLFRRLGVFSSPFTLEGIEAVCSGEGVAADDVLELLTELIQKSLVVTEQGPGDETRYRLLETVRMYARSRLAELDEHQYVQQRLVRFCTSIAEHAAERLHSVDALLWMDLLDDQEDNLRSVLTWCRTNDPGSGLRLASLLVEYWDLRGHLTEGRMWLAEFLNLNQTGDEARGNALVGAGLLAWRQGDNPSAKRYCEESLAIGRSTGDRALEGRALRGLGDAVLGLGEYSQADAVCRESLAIFRAIGDTPEIAQTLSRLGNAAFNQSEPMKSIPFYEESLGLYRQLGDRIGIANQLWSLGIERLLAGEIAQGRLLVEECLKIRIEIKDELGLPYARLMLGYPYLMAGDLAGARTEFCAGLSRMHELGDLWGIAVSLQFMSGLAVCATMWADSVRFAGASEAVRASIGAQRLPSVELVAGPWLADARRHLKTDEADRAYREGLRLTADSAVDVALGFLAPDPVRLVPAKPQGHGLSRRELQVATLASEGHTNRAIGETLFISERTVDNHVKHILEKLGFRSRAQIGAWLAARSQV